MISSIGASPYTPARCGHDCPRSAGGRDAAATSLAAGSVRQAVDGQLSLTTKEGDTVTISASAEASVTYAALRGRSADGRFAATATSLESSRALTVEVQGELSDEEMAEIRKVVKAFFHELRDAFRGRGFDVADVGDAGDGASTLAGFSVHIEASRSVTVVAAVARTGGALPLPVAPAGGEDGAPAGEAARPAPGLERVLGRLLSAARGSNLAPERLGRAVDRAFGEFARALRSRDALAILETLRRGVRDGLAQPAPEDATPVDVPAEPPASA